MAYFTDYGEAGLWSVGAMGLLLLLSTYGTLKIAYEQKSTEYGMFAEKIAGKWLGAVLDASVILSMLLGYGVMLAGSGAIFLQQWGWPEIIGALVMAGAVLVTLYFGAEGILAVNQFLTPILIGGILLVSIYGIVVTNSLSETVGLSVQPLSLFTAQPVERIGPALGSAVLYVSYNMLGAAAVLTGLSPYIQSSAQAAVVGCRAALIFVLLTFGMGLATFLNYDTIRDIPIPVLGLFGNHTAWRSLYVGVLLGAMYTTAVADGFGLLNRIRAAGRSGTIPMVWITVLAFVLAQLGFGALVEKGYRFLGYLGIFQMIRILIKCIPKRRQ